MATMFSDYPHTSFLEIGFTFLQSVIGFGLLTFLALRFPAKPVEFAHFRIERKPWDGPLGLFQFVFLTFLFVGVWGVGFSLYFALNRIDFALEILAMSTGGLFGALVAAKLYRERFLA
ncbi:hypothetical protein BH11PSE11_BH11PSE11_17790 [soil metagenome]